MCVSVCVSDWMYNVKSLKSSIINGIPLWLIHRHVRSQIIPVWLFRFNCFFLLHPLPHFHSFPFRYSSFGNFFDHAFSSEQQNKKIKCIEIIWWAFKQNAEHEFKFRKSYETFIDKHLPLSDIRTFILIIIQLLHQFAILILKMFNKTMHQSKNQNTNTSCCTWKLSFTFNLCCEHHKIDKMDWIFCFKTIPNMKIISLRFQIYEFRADITEMEIG